MLTRLKVSGFKNLVDVDVRFGPFTCIAGANGVGKSNLFDAINFLAALANGTLVEAALSVRDEGGRTSDIRNLFHHVGDMYADEISFEAEMIVPSEGIDDLGQLAKATITFLRYSVTLGCRADDSLRAHGSLELKKEELVRIKLSDASKKLLFSHKPSWRKSVLKGRRISPFISTVIRDEKRLIMRHGDGTSGRPLRFLASDLPRTLLSVANAAESPTALLARREMESWRLLQLEPSSLRQPNEFSAPTELGIDGSHLAATLYRLAKLNNPYKSNEISAEEAAGMVYGQLANRLAELIDDVHEVWVDRDDRRELFTLHVTDYEGTTHPARALSDGTLRFLALAVLELDPTAQGLLCFEEPENGIHPERIAAMLELLQDIATDTSEPIGPDNPLRQVIINTHSPTLVQQVPDESLLVAELKESVQNGQRFKRASFSSLPETWRQNSPQHAKSVAKGKLLAYLNPVQAESEADVDIQQRVIDRLDLQSLLPGFRES